MPKQSQSVVTGRARGWIAASLAAGPLYALVVLGPTLIRANAPAPAALLLVVPIATALGLWLAALPIGAAIWVGGWLGARSARMRAPAVWGLVGAGLGAAAGPALDVTGLGATLHGSLVGAAVAGIARRLVRWRDPVALSCPSPLKARDDP